MFGITRPVFLRGPEDAERAAGALDLLRQLLVLDPLDPLDVRRSLAHQRVELAAADDAEGQLRRKPGCFEDCLETVERDQLADEEGTKRPCWLPAGPEESFLCADEADREPLGGELAQLGELACVLRGVGNDEIGAPQRQPIDLAQHACRGRARREPAAILDKCLVKRDERVEDHRPPARDPSRRRNIEVAGVADDDRVEAIGTSAEEKSRLCEPDP